MWRPGADIVECRGRERRRKRKDSFLPKEDVKDRTGRESLKGIGSKKLFAQDRGFWKETDLSLSRER